MKKKWYTPVILLFTIALLTACNQGGNQTPETPAGGEANKPVENEKLVEATFILDWVPNTNHTGIYVAKEKGYFEEEGINLTIIEPALEGAEQIVAAGQAQFGISAQEGVTMARSAGIPVVSIAAIIQEHTSGFASPAEKNITSPKDFEGKTYGGWGSPLEDMMIGAVMEAYDADPSTVNNVTVGTADFLVNTKREIDFQWIFYAWDGINAEIKNEEINFIPLNEINPVFNYYSPVVISSEAVIAEQPELVAKFLQAVARGYEYAIAHPEEAADILITAVPEADAELIQASQQWLSPRYKGNAEKWGVQQEAIWNDFAAWMLENNLIENEVTSDEAMTNEFLQ